MENNSLLSLLREDQKEIVLHPSRFKVVAMGRRWGKTVMGGVSSLVFSSMGASVAWVAPTYKNSRPLWRFCEFLVDPRKVRIRRDEREIEFPGGGRIAIFSADNDVSILGESFDFVVVDEAARVPERTYSEVLFPTVADRKGTIILISTPKGKNWFYREWTRAKEEGAAWRAPSNSNPLPQIQRAYELAKLRLPRRVFSQEWDAEFLEDEGQVFHDVRSLAVALPKDPEAGHQYVIGVDWGRTNDATVFVVIDVLTREMVCLERIVDTNYSLQRARLSALSQYYNGAVIIAESNAMGLPNIEALQEEGVPIYPFTTTLATKAQVIDSLILAFEQKSLKILREELLIGELEAFSSERLPSGVIRYGAPEGFHDDTVMALALAWFGVDQNSVKVEFEV